MDNLRAKCARRLLDSVDARHTRRGYCDAREGREMNTQQIREFILAGNALFTLKSLRTTKHFTFKVVRKQIFVAGGWAPANPPTWTVQVLCGRDNSKDYRHVGSIRDGHFAYNASNSTPATKGFDWCWKHLERVGERFEFNHAGKCGRCGRPLTHPDSIQSGIGPECQEKMAFEAMGGAQGLLSQLFGG